MRTVKIVIEKSADMFTAFAENVEGIYAAGSTVEEVKASVIQAIKLLKENNYAKNIPTILKSDFKITYHFDTVSLLSYYRKIFTMSSLERLTGINQRQIQHYASGLKKPRSIQSKKIEQAFHQLGQ